MSLMSLLLHTADISHPAKPWRMHKKFADTILEEFFLQGDEEAKLGLPFSPLCDRNNVLIPESQISFIEFIVEPSLTIMTDLIDFVLNSDDSSSGPMSFSSAATKPTDNSSTSSDPKSSKQVTNSTSSTGNTVNNNNSESASTPPVSEAASSATVNKSDSSSSNSTTNKSTSPPSNVGRVPPPVPLRLSQAKSQIKPFQNLSAAGGTTGRRTESENCIKTAASSSSSNNNNSSSDAGGKIPLNSRTPSFPLQSGANHNYGPVLRPWNNHLVENKAKWRMISAGKSKYDNISALWANRSLKHRVMVEQWWWFQKVHFLTIPQLACRVGYLILVFSFLSLIILMLN